MKKLTAQEQVFIGITLFSMFFGAGNLIFPPFLAFTAGKSIVPAFLGFVVSAVGLPILAVIAVSKSGGLSKLSRKSGVVFADIFILLIYLSIGPCLAIPRTGTVSFEMAIVPFLPAGVATKIPLVAYSVVFFSIALFFSLRPSKLVETIGKKLAPVLIVLILALFFGSFFSLPIGTSPNPNATYAKNPAVAGFLDGYMTMDAIAALVYGFLIALNIRARGIDDDKIVMKSTFRAGFIAAILLALIYLMIAFVGMSCVTNFPQMSFDTGAQILAHTSKLLFGKVGGVLVGVIFFLACMNVCISLICSCAEYFTKKFAFLPYKIWAIVFAVVSAVIANAGLATILKVSVPILGCLYPVAIGYVIYAFLPKSIQNCRFAQGGAIWVTGFFSIVAALDGLGVKIPAVTSFCTKIPFYAEGLGWILPFFAGLAVGVALSVKKVVVQK